VRRTQQYRPLLPVQTAGMRQMRKPYVHVTRRTRKLTSPDSLGDTLVIGGGFGLGMLAFLGVMGLTAWYFLDVAVKG